MALVDELPPESALARSYTRRAAAVTGRHRQPSIAPSEGRPRVASMREFATFLRNSRSG